MRVVHVFFPLAGGVGGTEREVVWRVGVGDGRTVGVGLREAVAGVGVVCPGGCVAVGRRGRRPSRGAERGQGCAGALRVVGVAHGIGRAPFGEDASERIIGAVDGVAKGVSGRDAVAEHVVGVGFGYVVGVVGVGVGGEEVAGGGVSEECNGQDAPSARPCTAHSKY